MPAKAVGKSGQGHIDEKPPFDRFQAEKNREADASVGHADDGVAVGQKRGERGDDEKDDHHAQAIAGKAVGAKSQPNAFRVAFVIIGGRAHS